MGENKEKQSKKVKTILKVHGMHCPSCAMIIENEIEELEGVKDVECSYKKGIVKIETEKYIVPQKLNEMFEKFGYKFIKF